MRSRTLILWVVAFVAAAALIFAPSAHVAQASTSGVVISAAYGGGGNSGATYTHDYIEIFNAGSASVNITGWSIQYASATGTSWNVTALPAVTLAAGQSLIARQSAGSGGTATTPSDVDGTAMMGGGGAFKIALLSTTTAITGGSPYTDAAVNGSIVDFFGGGTANVFEGLVRSGTLTNTQAWFRVDGGCQDTDDNAADFEAATAYDNARSTASALAPCAAPEPDVTVAIEESQDPIAPGGNVTYTVTVANEGAAAAANVDLSVTLSGTAGVPTAYVISNLTESGVFCSTNASTIITCTDITSIAGGADYEVSFTVTAAQAGQIDVAASVATASTEGDNTNNTDNETTLVQVPAADLTVTTSWDPTTVYSHDTLDVIFTVNNGPLDDAENVTLEALFSGLAFDGLGTLPAGCTDTSPDVVECMLGTIAAGGNAVVTIPVDIAGAGNIEVDVDVATTSTESDAGNNSDNDTITVLPGCGIGFDNIYDYQEGGVNGAVRNVAVVFEGVVTADFQEARPGSIDGFYLQQVPGDGNALTSDGIYVHYDDIDVNEGDIVRIYGTISEFNGLTQLASITTLLNCGSGATVTPTTVTLPLANANDWENYEGMLVTVTDGSDNTLTVADQFNLDNFGEMIVATQKLYQPTHLYAPASIEEDATTDLNNRSKIIIDDGSGVSGPNPIPHYEGNSATHIRMGDSIAPITGVVSYSFNAYRVHYTEPLAFTSVVTRPTSVPAVGGRLKVGSFNVLNYFNGNGLGAGFPTSRGASNLAEFELQTTKLVAAILKLDADILGLMEIENDGGANQAAASLVNALNVASAPGTYAYIDTGVIGTDEIKVAIIYQPANVTPQGAFAIDTNAINDRPTLAQTFTEVSTGEDLTVVVNHFKSKGSCPSAGDVNADNGDGQSCWGPKRVQQAQRLLTWLDGDPTGQSDPDIIILGDLNSYAKETPITTLLADGYTNLIEDRLGMNVHSYYFSGQVGYLDHALSSAAIDPQITGVGIWNINADEPDLRDYNDFANTLVYKETNEFRTSDHDPVLIGVSLTVPTPPEADVTVAIVESQDPVTANEVVTYTVTVSNVGTVDATTTALTVDLSNTAYPGTIENISDTTNCSFATPTLTCTIGTLATGANFVVSFDVEPVVAGSIQVDAAVTADAPETAGNNTAAETTTVNAAPPAPGAFQLISPADGDILRTDATTFTWTESAGATSYDLLLVYLSTNTRVGEQYTATVDTTACAAGTCSLASSVLIPAGLSQGTYSWTAVANTGSTIEASNGPNLFTVVLANGIELVTNGSLDSDATGWTFTAGAKRKCKADWGNNSDCAIKLSPGAKAHQRGVMGPILAGIDTAVGDVLQVSAAVRTNKAAKQRAVMVVVNYVDSTAGANGNGKDKFKLFVEQATVGYETFTANFVLDGAIRGGRVVVANTLPKGNLRVDDVSVLLMPVGTAPRAGGEAPGSTDGLLPLPSAPDNFRGNN